MALIATVRSAKDGLVVRSKVVATRTEAMLSSQRARIWEPTVADLEQHYPEKHGYSISVRDTATTSGRY